MKKLLTMITSALLCMTMSVLGPTQIVASASDNGDKYISEVKVGMGETSEEASKELLAEGYTIFSDDKGDYADLNKNAGSKSILKGGPNQKIVYLGYKTTDDATKAVTDLAVMNMNGGYSYQAYENLIRDHMNSKIKPFVDRFIVTLNEYRENLQKPKDSINYKRANYYKTLLNKLTDDDTGNKPLGDLLVNKTKYEMGDGAYNKLSDNEKKNHCDILTLLMQGNGQTVQLMETELTKASDSSDNTWIDRFTKTSLKAMTEEVKKDNPIMTPSEINKELDKKYYDDAKKIRDKWDDFNDILLNYDNAIDRLNEAAETNTVNKNDINLSKDSSGKEIRENGEKVFNAEESMVKAGVAAEDIIAHDYLETTDYGDGTLLEFFERDQSEFSGDKNIRELYPIVEALSGGQLAGLDFLSIKDMVLMAATDENGFKKVDLKDMKPASIYQDVNREIYETGGVALTDDALRAQASAQQAKQTFVLSPAGIVLWSCTAAAGLAAVGSAAGMVIKPAIIKKVASLQKELDALGKKVAAMGDISKKLSLSESDLRLLSDYEFTEMYLKRAKESEAFSEATKQFAARSHICKYLTVGFTVAAVVLAGFSIYTTVTEMMEYYKVKFAPIPKYMVDRRDITVSKTVNGKTETIMVPNQTAYYKAVPCNRTDGSGSDIEKKNHEILKDRSDLNGDVGRQWLALYSVKYENGLPILADSLKLKMGSGDDPEGYSTGIHMFGETAAQNLTVSTAAQHYCYNDPYDGTYVYFKQDTKPVKEQTAANTATGSVFSGGSLAVGAVIGLLAGVGLTFLLLFSTKKRKEKQEV